MRIVAPLLIVSALTVALAPLAVAAPSADKCIKFWAEARYGALAWNHLVHVANICPAAAECAVSTDVNPEPQQVAVAGNTEVIVSTFMGSPARTFTPRVKCTMHAD
jgi:hypothetical protein